MLYLVTFGNFLHISVLFYFFSFSLFQIEKVISFVTETNCFCDNCDKNSTWLRFSPSLLHSSPPKSPSSLCDFFAFFYFCLYFLHLSLHLCCTPLPWQFLILCNYCSCLFIIFMMYFFFVADPIHLNHPRSHKIRIQFCVAESYLHA